MLSSISNVRAFFGRVARAYLAGPKGSTGGDGRTGRAGARADLSRLERYYDALWTHYLGGNVYEDVSKGAAQLDDGSLRPLRTLRSPAFGAVEFYAAKLALDGWLARMLPAGPAEQPPAGQDPAPLATTNPDLAAAVAGVWRESNLPAEGRPMVREYAALGDLILKQSHKEDGAGNVVGATIQRIDPANLTDFEKDSRGFFVYARLDYLESRRDLDGEPVETCVTEIWDKRLALYERYEHDKGAGVALSDLSDSDLVESYTLTANALEDEEGEPSDYAGFDFVPLVHAKCRDVGAPRGLGVFAHAMGDMEEADSLVTRLHEVLFPDQLWVLSQPGATVDGAELPDPVIDDQSSAGAYGGYDSRGGYLTSYHGGPSYTREGQSEYEAAVSKRYASVGRSRVAKIPAGTTLEPKMPQRDMSPLVQSAAEQVAWLERKIPETAYYKLRELDLSGVAMRTALIDVMDRYQEVGGNLAAALVRANQQALTIAQVMGAPGYEPETIGTFEAGDFEHSFVLPDPFPRTATEEAEEAKARAEAGEADASALLAYRDLGATMLENELARRGMPPADARRVAQEIIDAGAASRGATSAAIAPTLDDLLGT